jgi:MFS family permease
MKRNFPAACVFLIVCARAGQAEGVPAPQPASPPSTALEVLQHHIERNPQPLENRNVGRGLGLFLGGTAVTVGCVGLALIPTFEDWGPEEEEGQYFSGSLLGGLFQGMYVNMLIGFKLAELFLPAPDLRSEYGSLLDLDEQDRERRAGLMLRKIAGREKKRRVTAALLTLVATALPAGAYYLGTRVWGPNPNVEHVGQGYIAGIALGSLLPALMAFTLESETERLAQQLGSRQ